MNCVLGSSLHILCTIESSRLHSDDSEVHDRLVANESVTGNGPLVQTTMIVYCS